MAEPAKLGKYEILRELGHGAMGVVYEAFDPTIERTVALKTIRRDQLEGAEAADIITRFQREAKAAGRLNHPNIVSIYDFGDDGGTTYIAMEFVHGRELKSYFEQDERFPIAEAAHIMEQLLAALDYSHNYGVVHRDIKPANIIVQENRQVKVADFGIARIESSQYTQAGTVLGTPAYMSPEQFMGQTVDRRSDIFSAGVVLYQFLTGERPFSGAVTTIMHKVLSVDPPPPSMLNVQVPKLFDAVIAKAMAKRPEDRYQSASEFAAAIHDAAAGKGASGPVFEPVTTDGTVINTGGRTGVKSAMEMMGHIVAPGPQTAAGPEVANAPSAASVVAPAPVRKSPLTAVAASVAGLAIMGAAAYFMPGRGTLDKAPIAANTDKPAVPVAAAPAIVPSATRVVPTEPGTMVISAVGLADPSDQKYQGDKALLNADLRADSRSQLVEKAVALYVERASLAKNYDLLRDKLLAKSGDYISNIVEEGAPQLGKDGLMYVTTQAVVKVREVQKSLNQMSREERVDFIRNSGDPKISVTIGVRGESAEAPAQNSQVAENLLKERIKSFGFRIWSDEQKAIGEPGTSADFAVVGEARLKKLSARLEASGITINKFVLTSWTVKCVDKQTGEEIYYNNKLPAASGSWASEEQALAAIGGKIADEFSRDFFMRHVNATGRKVTLQIAGLADKAAEVAIARELIGLQPVISISRRADQTAVAYDLQISGGTGPINDTVASAILKPLNAKLGQACFILGGTSGEQVTVTFDAACGDPAVLARLENNPPASLYAATPSRQKSVVKDSAAIKRLTI